VGKRRNVVMNCVQQSTPSRIGRFGHRGTARIGSKDDPQTVIQAFDAMAQSIKQKKRYQ
jgi:hypothetical protein